MKGELAEGVVSDLLRQLYIARRTGTLHFVRGEERQSLRVRRGHIVNAYTNVIEERLGEMLVRRGLLSDAGLARATEICLRERRRLGEVLQSLGLIDASGLEDGVALHVHEMLTKVFSWNDGTYEFQDEEEGPGQELTLKLSTGELILEAVRTIQDPDVVRYALGDIDRVLALSNDPLLRFQKITLSPADGFILSRVDGTLSAREVIELIPLDPAVAQRSLLGLLSTGIVEYVPGRRRPRPGAGSVPAGRKPAAASSIPAPPSPSPGPIPPPTTAPPPPVPVPPAVSPPAQPARPSPPPPQPQAAAPAAHPPPAPSGPPPAPAVTPAPSTTGEPQAEKRRQEILEAWEGLKVRTHHEVLGIGRGASEAEVKEAYFGLAKRFHPDVHHGASLGDLRDKLEAVFIRLGEAYEVLRDAKRRVAYEERLDRMLGRAAQPSPPPSAASPRAEALEGGGPTSPAGPEPQAYDVEEAIRRAQSLVEKEKYWDAIQILEPAVDAAEGRTKLRAQISLARCYAKNPRWVKRAEELLQRIVRADPRSVDAYLLLGGIYRDRGLQARAVATFRKVLELSPDNEEAARFVGGAPSEPSPGEGGGGLLRKLFRKG